mgnify:FL=1|jgi:hypothetical protein
MANQETECLLSPWLRSVQFKTSILHVQGKVLDYGCGAKTLTEHAEPV